MLANSYLFDQAFVTQSSLSNLIYRIVLLREDHAIRMIVSLQTPQIRRYVTICSTSGLRLWTCIAMSRSCHWHNCNLSFVRYLQQKFSLEFILRNCTAMSISCHSHHNLFAHALEKGTGDPLQRLSTLECTKKNEIFIKSTKGYEED